jgi:hypothetical protein
MTMRAQLIFHEADCREIPLGIRQATTGSPEATLAGHPPQISTGAGRELRLLSVGGSKLAARWKL